MEESGEGAKPGLGQCKLPVNVQGYVDIRLLSRRPL